MPALVAVGAAAEDAATEGGQFEVGLGLAHMLEPVVAARDGAEAEPAGAVVLLGEG